jgi:hypothetical protein
MAIRIENQAEPIPGYRLIERLGGGGFGEVWKCEAPGGLLKAIKIVYGDLQSLDEDGSRRAEQELKSLKRVKSVRHPYLLSLERYDIVEGRLMIVMELADRNLWQRFQECRDQGLPGIPREELLRYLEEAAEVLDLMNSEYQLQHLDIKPQNLFLVHNHVKVADFGLVKDLEQMQATVTGGVTPVYAAPETFDGVVSRFCDQYSLGIVYQELLTGNRPFTGNSIQQLIMQHLTAVPNLSVLPASDRDAIAKALAKRPDDRHATCSDLVQALRRGGAPAVGAEDGVRMGTPGTAPSTPVLNSTTAALRPAPEVVPPRPVPQQTPSTGPRASTPAPDIEPQAPEVAEVKGDGTLFPALVIGLGRLGLSVLSRVREALYEYFGPPEVLPQLRLLYIDTDPETIREAGQGDPDQVLSPGEVLQARLKRAFDYLKPAAGRPRLDAWLDPGMVHRIPRSNPVTKGLRALGRLAFVDNYPAVSRRIHAELQACTDAQALAEAEQRTHLGKRSNRPRVYVVTSLAGGTGSGMFLDLAYVVRRLLKQMGYPRPEVVGLFLLPAADQTALRPLSLANAYAALTELNHFSSPEVIFSAHYDEAERPIADRDPPFSRCILLPLPPDEKDPGPTQEVTDLAGDFLCRDLTRPLGKAADECRVALTTAAVESGPFCQTFGMYRFAWPRRLLLQQAARALCGRLAQHWASRESRHLRDAVQRWVNEQWEKRGLDPEHFIENLQQACERAAGQKPEAAFAGVTGPLESAARPTSSFWGGRKVPDLDPAAVTDTLNRLEDLVGRPGNATAVTRRPSVLPEALPEAAKPLVASLEKKVVQLASWLIEEPDYRLAGAEEAISLLLAKINQLLEAYEQPCQEFGDNADNAHARIVELVEAVQAGAVRRGGAATPDIVNLICSYPKLRYQWLVGRQVIQSYGKLRNRLSEYKREIDFCRQRLTELQRSLESSLADSFDPSWRHGRYFLPAGCQSLRDAVDRILAEVSPAELQELDQKVQAMIKQQFNTLAHVCLTSGNLLNNLEVAMQQLVEGFLAPRLAGVNVVDMFLAQFPSGGDQALDALVRAYDTAAPALAVPVPSDHARIEILATPPGPQREQFCDLARRAVSETALTLVDSADDVVFYREQPQLPLASLDQLGPKGREAYEQMPSMEHCSPHTRTDVAEWRVPELT